MRLDRRLRLVLTAAAFGAACSTSAVTSPTAPVPLSTAPTRVAGDIIGGDIRFSAVTHASGSTLSVQNCGPAFTGIAGDNLCNMDWHAAFDVTTNIDLSNAVVTVAFEGARGRCGLIMLAGQNFGANQPRLVGTSDPIYLTYEPEGYEHLKVEQFCDLPTTTDRIVVSMWNPARPAAPLLQREFNYESTFVER